MKVFAVLPSLN